MIRPGLSSKIARGARYARARYGWWRRHHNVGPEGVEIYAFVVGCSRSGTTSLVRLLNSHPNVAIGMERYKHAFDNYGPHKITPAYFEPGRFFDFRPDDTNVTPDEDPRWRSLYAQLEQKFEANQVRVVGDKVPGRRDVLRAIDRNFPNRRLVFILRDLESVANSFVRRAEDPADRSWPRDKGPTAALREWNRTLEAVEGTIRREAYTRETLTVLYQTVFSDDQDVIHAIFQHLGLAPTDEVWDYRRRQQIDAAALRTKPSELINADQRTLQRRARRDLERRFIARAEVALTSTTSDGRP